MKNHLTENPLLARLRRHVTGAVERGEAKAVCEQKAAAVELAPCGSFVVRTASGRFLASQGATTWEQDTPQGWALFTAREEAQGQADRLNRQAHQAN